MDVNGDPSIVESGESSRYLEELCATMIEGAVQAVAHVHRTKLRTQSQKRKARVKSPPANGSRA